MPRIQLSQGMFAHLNFSAAITEQLMFILYINTLLEGFIFHFVPLGTKCIDTSRVHSTRDVSHISPSAKHEGLYEIYPES